MAKEGHKNGRKLVFLFIYQNMNRDSFFSEFIIKKEKICQKCGNEGQCC